MVKTTLIKIKSDIMEKKYLYVWKEVSRKYPITKHYYVIEYGLTIEGKREEIKRIKVRY